MSDDLVEADILCATYLRKLESVRLIDFTVKFHALLNVLLFFIVNLIFTLQLSTKGAFENFLSLNAWPKFQYPSMDNTSVVPLCPDGTRLSVR